MLRKLALAAASVLVTLALLELGIRLGGFEVHDFLNEQRKYIAFLHRDDRGGYLIHPAGGHVRLHGVDVRFNSLGLRDDEPRVPKPPGVFRILCLGDSMVYGPGVAQDAIFPARLRAAFAGEPIDVVAAGVQGWNTEQEERFLAANIARLDPDLVLLLYVTNDNEPTLADAPGAPAKRVRDVVYETLVLRSRLFEWAAFVRARARQPRATPLRPAPAHAAVPPPALPVAPQPPPASEPAFSPSDPGWLASRESLGRVEQLVRGRGARLVVWLYSMTNREPEPSARARLREFEAETGVAVFDTLGYFSGEKFAALVNAPIIDPHPNPAGHARLAAGLAQTLRAEGLVPVGRNGSM